MIIYNQVSLITAKKISWFSAVTEDANMLTFSWETFYATHRAI
jgi:hypothetical protein